MKQNSTINLKKKKKAVLTRNSIVFYILSLAAICISFIFGTISGMKEVDDQYRLTSTGLSSSSFQQSYASKCKKVDDTVTDEIRLDLSDKEKDEIHREIDRRVEKAMETNKLKKQTRNLQTAANKVVKTDIFQYQNKGNNFLSGVSRMNKNDFFDNFDYGTPNHPYDARSEGLIFYSNPKAFPDPSAKVLTSNDGDIPLLSTVDATKNCDVLHVVLSQTAQCIAIVGDYEHFHVQKWMRIDPSNNNRVNRSKPLQMVGRAQTPTGTNIFKSPNQDKILKNFSNLRLYLNNYQTTLAKLKEITKSIVKKQHQNTIIVMTCNLGQVDLLINFVCSTKSRGFDIGNVLLFATDKETHDIAGNLGIASFYDEKNFEDIPKKEARAYQDKTFVKMMYAKVVAAQTINYLGYNILFQDVDIIWYKNPLTLFHDTSSKLYDFDALFSRDGATSPRYAPYDANSGFYYIKANDKTKYMLLSMLYYGDLIEQTKSHQATFQAILAEYSSLFGIAIKVLDEEDFPGGHLFHKRDHTYMKRLISNKVKPYIFHMCWTRNKDDKVKYMKQMGWWYVKKCDFKDGVGCCLKEPYFECFYSDKASMKSCRDSPTIDRGGRSFW